MAVRFVAYTALLFLAWNHNLVGVPDGVVWSRAEPRAGYFGSESYLVLGRMAHPELTALHPLVLLDADGTPVAYRSQFGLPGVVLSAVGADPTAAAGAVALLTAMVLAAVFAAAHRWLGPPAGDVGCALAACTPIFLPFAPSLYWATFTLLAPFAAVWCLLPRADTATRRFGLLAGVGLLVMLKCLCGYEYLTTVVSAPVAAAWFHQHRAGEPPGRRVILAAGLVIAGGAGFAAAVGVHAAQLGPDGLAVIAERAAARTAGAVGSEATTGGSAAAAFRTYFGQRAVSRPGVFGRPADVPLWMVVAGVVTLTVAARVARQRLPREAAALAGACAVGLAAGLSWQVLAVNHMRVHAHFNLIVFAVPFLPLASLAAGYALRLAVGPAAGRWLGVAVLVGLTGVEAGTLVRDRHDRRVEASDQARAEAAVGAWAGGPADGGVGGAIDVVRTAAAVPPPVALEHGLLDPATGRPADPGAVAIQGWALAEWKTSRRPTARVVVTVGGAVAPCRVLRFRRPDLDRLAGRPLPGAGFVAVVPSGVAAGAPVRVFAVSAADPARITELTAAR